MQSFRGRAPDRPRLVEILILTLEAGAAPDCPLARFSPHLYAAHPCCGVPVILSALSGASLPVVSMPRSSARTKMDAPISNRLHGCCFDHQAIACAFDLLRLDADDLRRLPLSERKARLRKLLRRSVDGIQYVEHADATVARCTKPPASLSWRASSRRASPRHTNPVTEKAG